MLDGRMQFLRTFELVALPFIKVYFGIQHANACEKIANPLYCNLQLWPWSGIAFVADIQSMCNRTMDPSTHAHNLFHFVGVLVHVAMV